jgi:hypothetical protein
MEPKGSLPSPQQPTVGLIMSQMSWVHILPLFFFNQLSGYNVLTCHVVLCITVALMYLHTIADVMTASDADLYIVLVRSYVFFRVWQEGADCLIAVRFDFLCVNIMAGRSNEVRVYDEEMLYELLQHN